MWMFQNDAVRVTRLMMPVRARADGPVDQILAVLYPDRS
jgi:ribosomal protein L15E